MHGCAAELEELIIKARAKRLVLVGDLYTKGPDPVGVWNVIQSIKTKAVMGNHDKRLLDWLAGERPGDRHAEAVCKALDGGATGWREHLASLPLWRRSKGFIVTHAGLHPTGGPEATDARVHLYARRWPDDRSHSNPFWWQVYQGDPVIFGHDARRGHVRRDRDGKPWVIGLDTGCVYGGQLTGWLVQKRRVVSVPAHRVWCPTG